MTPFNDELWNDCTLLDNSLFCVCYYQENDCIKNGYTDQKIKYYKIFRVG